MYPVAGITCNAKTIIIQPMKFRSTTKYIKYYLDNTDQLLSFSQNVNKGNCSCFNFACVASYTGLEVKQ